MGGSSSQLSKELLNEYQDLTYLTKQEILIASQRFTDLLQKDRKSTDTTETGRVSKKTFLELPELKANPFKDRICYVFSTSENHDSMSFEDFLDMLSAFSDSATLEVKSYYAFRIYDFDGDGALSREDLEMLVNRLTGEEENSKLSKDEMRQLIDNILEESDIDKDGTINHSEFQHVISRSPDFVSSFKIIL
ncbi:hypothetical protein GDO81_009532 [Engystomops pustulosus]|uniref:EF-hand domain-containing protein n=1 Tax=Engystomops pustulosus TaxID=76066 RepID=A0AAV7BT08_ENGPU|nr:hypothetical protein GDO81_009532 [Engystomops pustulosus]